MGPQHWWPAGSAFEVVVGAYLTQNTAWTNVERAMSESARGGGAVDLRNPQVGAGRAGAAGASGGILPAEGGAVEALCRSSGRAPRRIAGGDVCASGGSTARGVAGAAGDWPGDGRLDPALCGQPRSVRGGCYTRRIFERHGLAEAETGYEEIRLAVQKALSEEGSVGEGDRIDDQQQEQVNDPSKSKVNHPTLTPQNQRRGATVGHPRFLALRFLRLWCMRPRRPPRWSAASFRSATTNSTRCWCRRQNTTA